VTKTKNQKLQLSLHHRVLKSGRLDKNGVVRWSKANWNVGKHSWMPRGLFYVVNSFVLRRVKETPDKSFPAMKHAVIKALCEAAMACSCTRKLKRSDGDVTWFLNGARFFAFQVEEFHQHADAEVSDLRALLRKHSSRFRKMERRSQALFRGCFVVLKGDFVKFIPGKTRNE
jgi:hypothetical protein